MGILDVKEDLLQRVVNSTSGTMVFVVYCDGYTDPAVIRRDDRIPQKGAIWPEDGGLIVDNISVKPASNANPPTVFTAEVSYSKSDKESSESVPPWEQPDDIDFGGEDATEKYFTDEDDSSDGPNSVINSAGESFEDLPERETGSMVITVVRNSQTFSPAQAVGYISVVNKTSFSVDGQRIDVGQAKMGVITAKRKYWTDEDGQNIKYYEVTYPLKIRESWDQEYEDRGYNEQLTTTESEGEDPVTTLKPILKGQPPVQVDKPWPLDGNGAACDNIDDEPAKLTFKPYKTKSFSVFNFR